MTVGGALGRFRSSISRAALCIVLAIASSCGSASSPVVSEISLRRFPYNGFGYRFVLRADGSATDTRHADLVRDWVCVGTVEPSLVQALADQMESQRFFEMRASYSVPLPLDGLFPDLETSAVRDGVRKTVISDDRSATPPTLVAVQAAIHALRTGIDWRYAPPSPSAGEPCFPHFYWQP
jgi:hypothetical protein